MAQANRETPVGFELTPLTKMADLEACQAFRGWPFVRNMHTDEDIAHQRGLPTVIMTGLQGGAYLSALCTRFFGEAWFHCGKLSLAFILPVFPPQRLTAKGIVKERSKEGEKVRLVLDVWLENEGGEKVQAGTASALL